MFSIQKDKYLMMLLIGVLIYTTIFTILCILRQKTFISFDWEDEAAYIQMAWNTAHSVLFSQTILIEGDKGKRFAGHLPLIFILFIPFFRLGPYYHTYYFLMSLFIGLGAIPIYLLGKNILNNGVLSFLITIGYFFYTPLHYVNFSTADTVVFAIPLLAFSFFYFIRKNFKMFMIFSFLTLMCREDLALIVLGVGIYALLIKREAKWINIPIILSCIWLCLAVTIIYFSGGYENDPAEITFRGSIPGLLSYIFSHPFQTLKIMFSQAHLKYFSQHLYPFLFLPLFSMVCYIPLYSYLLIMLIEGGLKPSSNYLVVPIIPFIFFSFIFVIKKIKLKNNISEFFIFGLVTLVLFLIIIGNFGHNKIGLRTYDDIIYEDFRFVRSKNILDIKFFVPNESNRIAWKLIEYIPRNASVAASGDLLVPLATRRKLLEFGYHYGYYDFFDVDYILIHHKNMYFGSGDYSIPTEKDKEKLKKMIAEGKMKLIFQNGEFTLVKRIN